MCLFSQQCNQLQKVHHVIWAFSLKLISLVGAVDKKNPIGVKDDLERNVIKAKTKNQRKKKSFNLDLNAMEEISGMILL